MRGSPVGSRMLDEPFPPRPNGALAGQMRPKPLLFERPSGLPTPAYWAVNAAGLFTLLSQCGLFALNICTAPPSAVAWSPLLSKSAGTTNVSAPLRSSERNEPCRPPPAASGAPKFDTLPTRRRAGSSTAPGTVEPGNLEGIGLGLAQGQVLVLGSHGVKFPPLTNAPICAMADAPGIFLATTRASTPAIPCARASPHPHSLASAATANIPSAIVLPICLMDTSPSFLERA